jgi:hypothetical protein
MLSFGGSQLSWQEAYMKSQVKTKLAQFFVGLLVAAAVVVAAVLAANFVLRAAPASSAPASSALTAAAHLATAQAASAKPAAEVRAERALPPEIAERHQHIQGLLTPFTKGELKSLVPQFRERLSFEKEKPDPRTIAQSEILHTFPRLTRPQMAVLTFDLIALSTGKDSVSDMSQEMQLKLQMSQQQYDACMQALSNTLKSISKTSDSVISNIK